jgi:hypothetical protein
MNTEKYFKSAEACFKLHMEKRESRKQRNEEIETRRAARKMRVNNNIIHYKLGHKNECWNCGKRELIVGQPAQKPTWTTEDYCVFTVEFWCITCCGDLKGYKTIVNNEIGMFDGPDIYHENKKCDCGCWE